MPAHRPPQALKEWAAAVGAIRRGHQTVLLRRGGLRDGPRGFVPIAGTFGLLEGAYHQNRVPGLLAHGAADLVARELASSGPSTSISVAADLTAMWQVRDAADAAALFRAVAPFTLYGDAFLETRLMCDPPRPTTQGV